jgi:formylglycine-generating enzyme required for sulfatase activity
VSRDVVQRRRWLRVLFAVLAIGVIAAIIIWPNEGWLRERWRWLVTIRPYMTSQVQPHVLSPAREGALKPGETFRECADDRRCPEMVVVPAGEFVMGSSTSEQGRRDDEGPEHTVTLAQPFTVSRFEITFAQWDACVRYGDCDPPIDDGYGRDRQPAINVTWDDAQRYVAWLSRMTGKRYRLLSEAEWEYAARAGAQTAYSWGDESGKDNANCIGCASGQDARRPVAVGSFAANAFGLFDMHGNVWEWVEDCYHFSYQGAPTDGAPWMADDCSRRVVRGGSWGYYPADLRAAARLRLSTGYRAAGVGLRVARTLEP